MKRNLTFLIVGIAIGFGIRPFLFQEHSPLPLTPILQTRSKIIIPTKEVERPSEPRLLEPLTTGAGNTSQVDKDKREPEKTYGLVINEENVAEMERQKDQLRNYAYTVQTAEGWKIQILPEDKVFLKAGLNTGDLITFESMNVQLQNPERSQLALRMVSILHQIRR